MLSVNKYTFISSFPINAFELVSVKMKSPTLWPLDAKSQRPWIWERLKAGGEGDDGRWHGWMASRLNGHEFKQVLGYGEGQGSLARSTPWGHKELDSIKWLNNNTVISVVMDWSFLLLCLLVILHWMPSIIKFPLHAWYFSNPKLMFVLYSEILLRCLETVWSSWVLLLNMGSVGPDQILV